VREGETTGNVDCHSDRKTPWTISEDAESQHLSGQVSQQCTPSGDRRVPILNPFSNSRPYRSPGLNRIETVVSKRIT